MITSAIPVIAVSDSVAAEDYYCRVLGFQKMFAYPPGATTAEQQALIDAAQAIIAELSA